MNNRSRVFLTGASGTVGSGILEALIADGGFEVFALVRNDAALADVERMGGHAVRGDLADVDLFTQLAAAPPFEYIVHAAQANYRRYTQDAIDDLEALSIRHLDLLRSEETKLAVFITGVWSYGTGARGGPITEATPRVPFAAARGRAELTGALLGRSQHPWTELCPPSMVYGDRGPFIDIASRLAGGGLIEVIDDDRVQWSVIERLDLGRACAALLRHGQPGETFVVAEDVSVGKFEFHQTIQTLVGSGRIVRRSRDELETAGAGAMLEIMESSQPVDSTRFKNTTGWRARSAFASAAPILIRGFQEAAGKVAPSSAQ